MRPVYVHFDNCLDSKFSGDRQLHDNTFDHKIETLMMPLNEKMMEIDVAEAVTPEELEKIEMSDWADSSLYHYVSTDLI